MRLFVYTRHNQCNHKLGETNYVVSVDPGVKTNGICVLDKASMSLDMEAYEEPKINANKIFLPFFYAFVRKQVQRFIDTKIKPLNGNVECVVEFAHMTGEFSLGMSVVVATWLYLLFNVKKVKKVTLIPNRVPEFFLKKKSVTPIETVWFARNALQEFVPEKDIAVHAYDALLYILYTQYDLFQGRLSINVRKPEPQIVEVPW